MIHCRNRRRRRRCSWWRTCSWSWRCRAALRARTCTRTWCLCSPSSAPRPTSSSSAGALHSIPFTPSGSECEKRFPFKMIMSFSIPSNFCWKTWMKHFLVKSLSLSVNRPSRSGLRSRWWSRSRSGSCCSSLFYSISFPPNTKKRRYLKKNYRLCDKNQTNIEVTGSTTVAKQLW